VLPLPLFLSGPICCCRTSVAVAAGVAAAVGVFDVVVGQVAWHSSPVPLFPPFPVSLFRVLP